MTNAEDQQQRRINAYSPAKKTSYKDYASIGCHQRKLLPDTQFLLRLHRSLLKSLTCNFCNKKVDLNATLVWFCNSITMKKMCQHKSLNNETRKGDA